MNDDQFDDLKQFIDSRISQTEALIDGKIAASETLLEARIAELAVKLDMKLEDVRTEVHELRDEMRDGFVGVGEAIETLHAADDELDQRLANLERQAAA